MDHVLDNPIWNALTSWNSNQCNGNNKVKYFDKEIAPFVGLEENTFENLKTIHKLLPHSGPIVLFIPAEIAIPDEWKLLNRISGFQMTYNGSAVSLDAEIKLIPLTEEHVPQMLALTQLTNPGPFSSKTIEFGHYSGVFDGDQLVAMAGQRLHVTGYAEISAVCTHPDYLGRGYAQQLLLSHVNRIKAASETPFLHVRHDNNRAIKVYERLGFSARAEIYFYVLQKA